MEGGREGASSVCSMVETALVALSDSGQTQDSCNSRSLRHPPPEWINLMPEMVQKFTNLGKFSD